MTRPSGLVKRRAVFGHRRKAFRDGGSWRVECACGWIDDSPMSTKRVAYGVYSDHIAGLMPVCSLCNTAKKTHEMSKVRHTLCKACSNAKTRAWKAENPEDYDRHGRKYHLKKQYGITIEQYDTMLVAQGAGCAICGSSIADIRGFRPHVDHCHGTGIIRGILCGRCNRALGQFKDDASLLRRAIAYLETPR